MSFRVILSILLKLNLNQWECSEMCFLCKSQKSKVGNCNPLFLHKFCQVRHPCTKHLSLAVWYHISIFVSACVSLTAWRCLAKWKDWEIIHCRIMMVQQLINSKSSWGTARRSKASRSVSTIVYQAKWHVWNSWKCVLLHLNMIWSTFRLNLLLRKRIGAPRNTKMTNWNKKTGKQNGTKNDSTR